MRPVYIAPLTAVAFFAFGTSSGGRAEEAPYLTPYDAIWRAAENPKRGVTGTFKMTVRAHGAQSGVVYLNSEKDYRDPRNLSLDILPASQVGMVEKFGKPSALVGKTIAITGAAKRTKIWFFSEGRRTQKYYYQTHIAITSPEQVNIVEP